MARYGKTLTLEQLSEIIKLHTEGWSSTAIGKNFDRDHSTIIYHLQRFRKMGIIDKDIQIKITTKSIDNELKNMSYRRSPRCNYKYQEVIEEDINPGKSYKQYLSEARAKASPKMKHFYKNRPRERGFVDSEAKLVI